MQFSHGTDILTRPSAGYVDNKSAIRKRVWESSIMSCAFVMHKRSHYRGSLVANLAVHTSLRSKPSDKQYELRPDARMMKGGNTGSLAPTLLQSDPGDSNLDSDIHDPSSQRLLNVRLGLSVDWKVTIKRVANIVPSERKTRIKYANAL
ncbi:hypothetical protein CHU98_g5982 [Xylaria longipes]|nr:hypothetical protein CHU98_g5982 [Xylaria longipes]